MQRMKALKNQDLYDDHARKTESKWAAWKEFSFWCGLFWFSDPLGMGTGTVRDEQNKQRHNASEQRRREKLNKLMDDLKALLPECKNSKFNVLDKAIQHIKNLQLQSIQFVTTNKMLEEENQRLSKMLQNVKTNVQLTQSGNTVLTASGNINNINANNGTEAPVNATAAATTMATLLAQSNFQPDQQSS